MAKYKSEGIECPECGAITKELFNAKSKSGQEVLLCDACKPAEDKPQRDFSWIHGGLNE